MSPSFTPSPAASADERRAGDGFPAGELAHAALLLSRLLGDPSPLTLDEAREAAQILGSICPCEFRACQPDIKEFMRTWNEERSLFLGPVPRISLEESVYKSWTDDAFHPLRGAKGLTRGDPARHMERLLRDFGIALDSGSLKAPDHIGVLLEFLAILLENRSLRDAAAFCNDHLDWMPQLRAALDLHPRGHAGVKLVKALEALVEIIAR